MSTETENEEDECGSWMMEFAQETLEKSGFKTPEEWSLHHNQDFYDYISEIA